MAVNVPRTESVTRSVTVEYAVESALKAAEGGSKLLLALDAQRGVVGLRGEVKKPLLLRDALATLAAVLGSDLRYRHRDRSAYLAYLAKQGKRANAQVWEAQKQFLDEQFSEDTRTTSVLDPVLTVDPDQVSLEAFSRDESAYARLALSNDLFGKREAAHGSACVELGPAVMDGLDRLRTWQPVTLEAGTSLQKAGAKPRDEKVRKLEVPRGWLRGFLQVQSAATLPSTSCEFAPIDLYNLLFALRTRRAKVPPRALRFELVPGAPARLVLEPWDVVLEGHGPAWAGGARVVRTFGRARLVALARLLPHLTRVRVQLLGGGLPVFWILDFEGGSLVLGLTGWSAAGWSSAASFDQLMPPAGAAPLADEAQRVLSGVGPQSFEDLQKALRQGPEKTRAALQLACLRGQIVRDVAQGTYRRRSLLSAALPDDELRYASPGEARAHLLVGEEGKPGTAAIRLTKLHEIVGQGLEIHGEIEDRESHRTFAPRFELDPEGRVQKASCGCPQHKRSGLKEGPCEHLLALRLTWEREKAAAEARRHTPEGRELIRAETRTCVRRDAAGHEVAYRVALDGKLVLVSWGPRTKAPRDQRFWYDTDDEARQAYFARLEALAAEGYVDLDSNLM